MAKAKVQLKKQATRGEFIALADGVKLWARLHLPQGKAKHSALIALPPLARLGDLQALADDGYGVLALDPRGLGNSQGRFAGGYTKDDEDDVLEVIAWAAQQEWCDGAAGLLGFSAGATLALQVAARQPPALKAVVAIAASDDRYDSDVAFKGGVLLGENLRHATNMLVKSALPPEVTGKDWKNQAVACVKTLPFTALEALQHPTRDEHWRKQATAERAGQITAATLLICGWRDGAAHAQFRLAKSLRAPHKVLVGNWGHDVPQGIEGEVRRWFDAHVKGVENGVMADAAYRVWLQDRWLGLSEWDDGSTTSFYLTERGISTSSAIEKEISFTSSAAAGLGDEARQDSQSLTFDSPPLAQDLVIAGAPDVALDLTADKADAQIYVRLLTVSPSGIARRVTQGLLDLSQRVSRGSPSPLEPGRRYRVTLKLDDMADSIHKGHRLRLAISTAAFPLAWPAAEKVKLSIFVGSSELRLPLRADRGTAIDVALAAPAAPAPRESLRIDPKSNELRLERQDGGVKETFLAQPDDPLSAWQEVHAEQAQGKVRAVASARLHADATHWLLSAKVEVFDGKTRLAAKEFREKIKRKPD